MNYDHFVYSGLPVPIVAIAAGIANEHYGTERGLAYSMYYKSNNFLLIAFSYILMFIDVFSCWLSEVQGTIWAFVAPMLLIILVS